MTTQTTELIDTEHLYFSNGGNGPLVARILEINNGFVYMERWHQRKVSGAGRMPSRPQRSVVFKLSVDFLNSEICGWKQ